MRVPLRLVGFFSVLVVATATHAFAGQRWEIEAHGGVLMSTNPTNGTVALLPAGPDIPLNAALPNSITRRVPSWYFGDGAAILNQIVGVRSPVKIAPLDPMLESRIVERQSATSFGVRVDRSLTPRFGVEFGLDEAQGELTLRSSSKDVASASQASFPAMWNLLLSALSSGSQVVTSDAMIDDKRGRQLVTSGTLLINLLSSTSFTPYVAVGAGYITAHNGAPSMTLVGNYSFTFAPIPVTPIPPFHINETDTVKIQAAARNSMTWVFGGGVKYALGDRWGVRADLRDQPRRRSNHGDDKPDVSTGRIRNVDSCLVAKRSATRLRFVTFIFVDAQHSGSRIPDVFRIGTRESSERVSGSLLAILTRASDACRATSLPATRSS